MTDTPPTDKPSPRKLVAAFSGGKDSTAMVLRLHESGESFRLLYTATGNELPEVRDHIQRIASLTGAEFVDLHSPTLEELIDEQQCLPNWRMRWCTRMIKIEPCKEWLESHPEEVLAVGLRADEEGRAGGTYEGAEIIYPMREWNWGLGEVVSYLERREIAVPKRTDCAVCFFQTLEEWRELWLNHPEEYARGEAWEAQIGHTFRSNGRDTWPAGLAELRQEFERGRMPKKATRKVRCRVCDM
jgi:3'-phosphoadenosine 5'-phosphosulfate sulfotransferase (PAPS reductase)/FAD synthetase